MAKKSRQRIARALARGGNLNPRDARTGEPQRSCFTNHCHSAARNGVASNLRRPLLRLATQKKAPATELARMHATFYDRNGRLCFVQGRTSSSQQRIEPLAPQAASFHPQVLRLRFVHPVWFLSPEALSHSNSCFGAECGRFLFGVAAIKPHRILAPRRTFASRGGD